MIVSIYCRLCKRPQCQNIAFETQKTQTKTICITAYKIRESIRINIK